MKCIYCGSYDTTVSNSATSTQGNKCRRVLCKTCNQKFYTIEKIAEQTDLKECREALWKK